MFSSVQVVLLYDVNCLQTSCASVHDYNGHVAAFKLACLRLLTEFGAQTENESDIRWAAKYYDSAVFKPGKTNNSFWDFNRRTYDNFDSELSKKLQKSTNIDDAARSSRLGHSECFILNKAIQEALKDYNWDLPDISSPVRSRKSRLALNGSKPEKTSDVFNAIVVFCKLPQTVEAARKFLASSASASNPQAFAKEFIEKATEQALEELQDFKLIFIDCTPEPLNLDNDNFRVMSNFNSHISKFNGAVHSINSLVDCSGLIFNPSESLNFTSLKLHLRGLEKNWFCKGRNHRAGRLRKPQPGPLFIWKKNEDVQVEIKLEILVLQGR